jgi:hypothetical protein
MGAVQLWLVIVMRLSADEIRIQATGKGNLVRTRQMARVEMGHAALFAVRPLW